jgi:hypothetical protein
MADWNLVVNTEQRRIVRDLAADLPLRDPLAATNQEVIQTAVYLARPTGLPARPFDFWGDWEIRDLEQLSIGIRQLDEGTGYLAYSNIFTVAHDAEGRAHALFEFWLNTLSLNCFMHKRPSALVTLEVEWDARVSRLKAQAPLRIHNNVLGNIT